MKLEGRLEGASVNFTFGRYDTVSASTLEFAIRAWQKDIAERAVTVEGESILRGRIKQAQKALQG